MQKDIKEAAYKYLEHRDHSAYEVRNHLKKKDFSDEEITDVLEFLVELHYVDDEKFCDSYIRYGISKGKGPIRLQQELGDKGISGDLVKLALHEQLDSEVEKENAREQARKVLGTIDNLQSIEEKTLAKVARRLTSLGYNTSVIYDVIVQLKTNIVINP